MYRTTGLFASKRKNTNKLLEGKVAVVTGGGEGVGLDSAQEFVEPGETTYAVPLRQVDRSIPVKTFWYRFGAIPVALLNALLNALSVV
jgi:NAD(P)-dependent dehydrogenase (short-subunit alcohol dehydrogenase family)